MIKWISYILSMVLLFANAYLLYSSASAGLRTIDVARSSPVVEIANNECPLLLKNLRTELAVVGDSLSSNPDVLSGKWWIATAFTAVNLVFAWVFVSSIYANARALRGSGIGWPARAILAPSVLTSSALSLLLLRSNLLSVLGAGWEVALNRCVRDIVVLLAISLSILVANALGARLNATKRSVLLRGLVTVAISAAGYVAVSEVTPRIDLYNDFGQHFVVDILREPQPPNRISPKSTIGEPVTANRPRLERSAENPYPSLAIATLEAREGSADNSVDVVLIAFRPGVCHPIERGNGYSSFGANDLTENGYILPRIMGSVSVITPLNDAPYTAAYLLKNGALWAWRLHSDSAGLQGIRVSLIEVDKLQPAGLPLVNPRELMWAEVRTYMRGPLLDWNQIVGLVGLLSAGATIFTTLVGKRKTGDE